MHAVLKKRNEIFSDKESPSKIEFKLPIPVRIYRFSERFKQNKGIDETSY